METMKRTTLTEEQHKQTLLYLDDYRDILTARLESYRLDAESVEDAEVIAGYELACGRITNILLAMQKADTFVRPSDDVLEYVTILKKEYWRNGECPVCKQTAQLRYLHGTHSQPSVKICNSCADELSKQLDAAHDAMEHTYLLTNKQVFAIKQLLELVKDANADGYVYDIVNFIDWDKVCTDGK